MTTPTPQNRPTNSFGEEVLPFDVDADHFDLNTLPEEDADETSVNWQEVEDELESWTSTDGEGGDTEQGDTPVL